MFYRRAPANAPPRIDGYPGNPVYGAPLALPEQTITREDRVDDR